MTRADMLLHQEIIEILENGYKDVNPRPKYPDGTPAHTISINHTVRSLRPTLLRLCLLLSEE